MSKKLWLAVVAAVAAVGIAVGGYFVAGPGSSDYDNGDSGYSYGGK